MMQLMSEDQAITKYFVQGSTYVNTLYGQVNRTGLVLAGAALLGVSGNYGL